MIFEKIGSGNLFYHTKNAARANGVGASAVTKELSKRFKVVKNKSSSDDETSDTSESQ
jgi:phosphoribosyl-ATP pyrophosphohydrolase